LTKYRNQKILLAVAAITLALVTSSTGLQFAIPQANAQSSQQPSPAFPVDITQDVQILTIDGQDRSGRNMQIEIILSRGLMMMMHPMMMSNPNWMFGMMGMMGGPMMGQGMMGPGMMGQQGQPNPQLYQQMIDWMRSHYSVQGGSLTVGDKIYMIEFGSARISNDRLFMNVAVDGVKTGKMIVYGKMNADDALKGTLLLWETRTSLDVMKIQGKGTMQNAFP
jgi:hypothetical protein